MSTAVLSRRPRSPWSPRELRRHGAPLDWLRRDDHQRALDRMLAQVEEANRELWEDAEREAMDDPTFRLPVRPSVRVSQLRKGVAGLLESLTVLLVDVEPTTPPSTDEAEEVAEMVDQLVPPLVAAPSAPPAPRVALLAA